MKYNNMYCASPTSFRSATVDHHREIRVRLRGTLGTLALLVVATGSQGAHNGCSSYLRHILEHAAHAGAGWRCCSLAHSS